MTLVLYLVNVIENKSPQSLVFRIRDVERLRHGVDEVELLVGDFLSHEFEETYYNDYLVVLLQGLIDFFADFQHLNEVGRVALSLLGIRIFARRACLHGEVFVEEFQKLVRILLAQLLSEVRGHDAPHVVVGIILRVQRGSYRKHLHQRS